MSISRRTLLQTLSLAAARQTLPFPTIALGAESGRAGPRSVDVRAQFRHKDRFFIGTQYLRPPNPRPEDFDRDLSLMRKTGLKLAKTWLYWSRVNPKPGVWDFAEYGAFFDAAGRQGMQVLVQLMTESAPYWLEAQHPEFRYVDADGRAVPLQSVSPVQVGGFPGFCWHVPGARAAIEEFIGRAADHCRGRKEVTVYDVWNEIWNFVTPCVCSASQAQFHEYLHSKYRSIDALNRAYGGSVYTDFSQTSISPSKFNAVLALRFDSFDFMRDANSERMKWLVTTLLKHDPGRTVVAHYGPGVGLDVYTDPWDLAAPLDKWGASCYLGDFPGGSEYPQEAHLSEHTVHHIALQFNTIRDSAQGKPWWLAEHTAGQVWSGYGFTRRAESTLKTLLALSFGADASLYWQWRSEIFGEEATHFGMTGLDGEATRETEAVANICRMLLENAKVFDGLAWDAPRVALLWDPTSAYFAQCTEEKLGTRHFEGLHAALIDSGHDVAILNAKHVAASGVPPKIKVLFAPTQNFDRTGLSEKLAAWVRAGGTLVAGPLFQLFGADRFASRSFPIAPMDEVFGVRHKSREFPEKSDIGGLCGERLVETFSLRGAEVLASWEHEPALTHNRFGAGHAVMFGSFFGASYPEQAPQELRDFINRMCRVGGVEPAVKVSAGCLARVAKSAQSIVAFVFNFSDQKQPCEIAIPGAGLRARELISGTQLQRSGSDPFHVSLEAKQTNILLIQKT